MNFNRPRDLPSRSGHDTARGPLDDCSHPESIGDHCRIGPINVSLRVRTTTTRDRQKPRKSKHCERAVTRPKRANTSGAKKNALERGCCCCCCAHHSCRPAPAAAVVRPKGGWTRAARRRFVLAAARLAPRLFTFHACVRSPFPDTRRARTSLFRSLFSLCAVYMCIALRANITLLAWCINVSLDFGVCRTPRLGLCLGSIITDLFWCVYFFCAGPGDEAMLGGY